MPNSLKSKLKKLKHEGKISQKEYDDIIKKLQGHDRELLNQTLEHIQFDPFNVSWYRNTQPIEDKIVQCDTCGRFYKPVIGHECLIYEGPMLLKDKENSNE